MQLWRKRLANRSTRLKMALPEPQTEPAEDNLPEEFESTSVQIGASWSGFSSIRRLIIFGDSYSAVGYCSQSPSPTAKNPLGVKFPGYTWNEQDKPNWVGHLLLNTGSKLQSLEDKTEDASVNDESALLVYDYAVGGHRVQGVVSQVTNQFMPHLSGKPIWNSNNSLFITWVGINDCAYSDEHSTTLQVLFSLQEQLYSVGARNFLFINVPPIHRSPAVPALSDMDRSPPYRSWNKGLSASARAFAASHPDITVLIYSSFATFSAILDDPSKYGFAKGSGKKRGGDMWVDHLHPTSGVHACIANDLKAFLDGVPAVKVD